MWRGPCMIKYGNLIRYGNLDSVLQKLRENRNHWPYIEKGGWHFSYLGGVARIKEKLASIIDSSPEMVKIMKRGRSDDEYVEDCLRNGKDLYGREGEEFRYEFIAKEYIGLPYIDKIIGKYPYLYRSL